MASTTLNVGNAIGLAIMIAIANRHTQGLSGDAFKLAVTEGMQTAFSLAAAGIAFSILLAFTSGRLAE
jgi:hypothetical protein